MYVNIRLDFFLEEIKNIIIKLVLITERENHENKRGYCGGRQG